MTARKIEITTLATLAGTADCTDRYTCPAVHALDTRTDVYHLVVKADAVVTDPAELAALAPHLGKDEIVVIQSRAVIDQLREASPHVE